MTAQQIGSLGPALGRFLAGFRSRFVTGNTFAHLLVYCRGLLSDRARKSVEPIELAAGCAARGWKEGRKLLCLNPHFACRAHLLKGPDFLSVHGSGLGKFMASEVGLRQSSRKPFRQSWRG